MIRDKEKEDIINLQAWEEQEWTEIVIIPTTKESKRIKKQKKTERNSRLKSKYGMTEECYDRLLKAQSYRCAICAKKAGDNRHGKLVVDHNHDTGAVRGLLCGLCNSGIGMLQDDSLIVHNAFQYLALHDGENTEIDEINHPLLDTQSPINL